MRILILSRDLWKKSNSFGNTYSNIFDGMEDIQIANIFLTDGEPDADNSNVTDYYKVSELGVLKSVLKRRCKENQIGEKFNVADINTCNLDADTVVDGSTSFFGRIKQKHWSVLYLCREIIWKYGQINYNGILNFVEEFNPDIIFLPFYYNVFIDRIALKIKEKFDIPMVLETSIDIYSLNQISFDPFYWINRFWIRSMIRRCVKKAEKMYVISEKMKNDYEQMLGIKCDILYKFPDYSRRLTDYSGHNEKIRFLYTGNLVANRWRSLGTLGDAISESGLGTLDIYSATPITSEMRKALVNCALHPPVSSLDVIKLQNSADVLVHVESFNLKDKLLVRYSISTKIMDYLSVGRCILAVGPRDIASVEFLNDNDIALVATDLSLVKVVIAQIKKKPNIIDEYSKRVSEYKFPQSRDVLQKDLLTVIEKYKAK